MENNTTDPLLLALIPAYNESQHIVPVIQGALRSLPVLVVDDGSSDSTAEIAAAAGAQVLLQRPNQGKGAALMNGFRRALELGAQAVIMLDADGQHDPAEIPAFINVYTKNHPDLIIGKRDFSGMPPVRRVSNTIGTWLFSWAVGQPVPDNQSGYRMLSRRMLEATLASRETSFEFEVEMIVTCIQRGYALDWVPIRTIYGDEKSHIRPLRHLFHFLRMVWQTRQAIHRSPQTPKEK
jgi:glycosyltransferase involved in cell wall biosynthesis